MRSSIGTYYFRLGSLPDKRCAPVQSIYDSPSKGGFRGVYSACGSQYGVTMTNKYGVAIKGGRSMCGRKMKIYYGTKSINAVVVDECPGCGNHQKIDVSLEALTELAGVMNACAINTRLPSLRWHFI